MLTCKKQVMQPTTYSQRCGLAKALELVGERWTLLVVRELLAGPRRYTELLDGIPGVATNVLANRLRALEEWSVIRRRRLGAPRSADVYELDEEGRELLPALRELTRWGMRQMAPGVGGEEFRTTWLVLAMHSLFQATQLPTGTDLRVQFEVGSEPLWARIRSCGLEVGLGEIDDPQVRAAATRELFIELAEGRLEIADAPPGLVEVSGDPELLALLPRAFPPIAKKGAAA